ncbi:MAG: hypothetical protein ACP5G1_02955 [Nanopusillaceae archaeon]
MNIHSFGVIIIKKRRNIETHVLEIIEKAIKDKKDNLKYIKTKYSIYKNKSYC